MTSYRIKGTGSVREVYDGQRLVGTITRRSREVMSWRIGPTSATGRKVTDVWWVATTADGRPVRRFGDGKRLCLDHMKDWARPDNWPALPINPEEV